MPMYKISFDQCDLDDQDPHFFAKESELLDHIEDMCQESHDYEIWEHDEESVFTKNLDTGKIEAWDVVRDWHVTFHVYGAGHEDDLVYRIVGRTDYIPDKEIAIFEAGVAAELLRCDQIVTLHKRFELDSILKVVEVVKYEPKTTD